MRQLRSIDDTLSAWTVIKDELDGKADLRPAFIKDDPYCIAGRTAPKIMTPGERHADMMRRFPRTMAYLEEH